MTALFVRFALFVVLAVAVDPAVDFAADFFAVGFFAVDFAAVLVAAPFGDSFRATAAFGVAVFFTAAFFTAVFFAFAAVVFAAVLFTVVFFEPVTFSEPVAFSDPVTFSDPVVFFEPVVLFEPVAFSEEAAFVATAFFAAVFFVAVFFATMAAAPSHFVITHANRAGTINRLESRGNGARRPIRPPLRPRAASLHALCPAPRRVIRRARHPGPRTRVQRHSSHTAGREAPGRGPRKTGRPLSARARTLGGARSVDGDE
ncbi:hypothetical protein [Streptomyces hokutonensis]|uniref:hypothetical protein n=1 Tax=Streptomyces hokutonensis TaxID=1306990 RepID=UPI003F53FD57